MLLVQGFSPSNEADLTNIMTACSKPSQCQLAYRAWTLLHSAGQMQDAAKQTALMAALRSAHQFQQVISIHQAMQQAKVCLGLPAGFPACMLLFLS